MGWSGGGGGRAGVSTMLLSKTLGDNKMTTSKVRTSLVIASSAATLALVALTGCAGMNQSQMVWQKAGADQEQFNRDKVMCNQYGMQSAQAHGLSRNLFVQRWINDEFADCMKQLGYRLIPASQVSSVTSPADDMPITRLPASSGNGYDGKYKKVDTGEGRKCKNPEDMYAISCERE